MKIDISNSISQMTNGFNSNIGNNIKTASGCSNSNKSFDDFMSKVNNNVHDSNSNKVKLKNDDKTNDKLKSNKLNDDDGSNISKVNDDKSNSNSSSDDKKVKLSKETKKALKSIGASDKEINNIKSLDDLKSLIEKKLLDSDNLQKLLSGSLLNNSAVNKLLMLFMTSSNQANIQSVSDNIIADLKNQINDLLKGLSGQNSNDKITQLLDNFKDNVQKAVQANCSNTNDPAFKVLVTKNVESQILNLLSGNMDESKFNSMLPKVKQELISLLNDAAKDVKNQKVNNSDVLNNLVNLLKQDQGLDKTAVETYSSADNLDSNNSNLNKDENLTNNQSTKDESFLNLLTNKDDKSSGISKVTNFMNQFNNTVNNLDTAVNGNNITINKANLNNDIIKALKYMESNNVKNLTVKINPKELGEVTINLTMEAGEMKANITASTKDAYNLLNSNIANITNKLQNNDIKIQNVSLGIYNEDTTFFKDGSNSQENSGQGSNKDQKHFTDRTNGSNDDTLDSSSSIDSNVNMLA